MGLFKRKTQQKRDALGISFLINGGDEICVPGYTSLDKNPEIMTACHKIAQIIGAMTIYLMSNTEAGDVRIVNELSRKLDINPNDYMTRQVFMETIVMNALLYGRGNSIVRPHTSGGLLEDLEPIPAYRVGFREDGRSYKITIDGVEYSPDELLHFVYNPDKYHPWKGQGITVQLQSFANNLKQAAATEKAFLSSKYKPSIIVKVDALAEEFSNKAGREKLMEEYLDTNESGEPWIVPADTIQVEQVKPLTLHDLAISDNVQLNRRMVASIVGVPAFLLGVGEYKQAEWNAFIKYTVWPLVTGISQEMTKKLILSPKWYIKFNMLSLYDWDLSTISTVLCAMGDRGWVTGNEARDRIGMSPKDGLDELRVLENYIPNDMSGLQKKLNQEEK